MGRGQGVESVGRVAQPGSVILNRLDAEPVLMAGDGKGQHVGPAVERGDDAVSLVRRAGTGDEPDLVESRLLAGLFGHDEVPVVNWVERPTEDADTHANAPFGESLSGRATRWR